jgi:ABC-2 type transport system ATP-binding protein
MSSSAPPTSSVDPALVERPTVTVDNVSVWFGPKVALTDLTCSFGPGVTGLVGPNGAGKTTLMRSITGLLAPRVGRVTVEGVDPRRNRDVYQRVSLVPEDESVPEDLTARQLVAYVARLHRIRDRGVVDRVIDAVEMGPAADRRLGGFSKGMRQRVKVAAALVSNPSVLVLDEPLNGTDPVQRASLIRLFRALGDQGRTVIVSSHVLHELEVLADRVLIVVGGRLAAAGDRRAIRAEMAGRPQRFVVRSPQARSLAAALLALDSVAWAAVAGDEVTVAASRARDLSVALARVARDVGATLEEVRPLDDSLESLFRELVRR